jgi:putative hydrolase of the HAD superfamily
MLLSAPKALLFDLGGVLVDIDFSHALQAWAPYSALPFEGLRARFKYDAAYERHERGQMGGEAYFGHLARVLELSATAEDIERGWNSIFVSEILETRLLVQALRKTTPCYGFTNTNASHQATWSRLYPGVVQAFDRIFASHEIGLRKPEPDAFMRICELTQVPPEGFMFFDDLAENVQAARDIGFRAVLVRSTEDVRQALSRVRSAA